MTPIPQSGFILLINSKVYIYETMPWNRARTTWKIVNN